MKGLFTRFAVAGTPRGQELRDDGSCGYVRRTPRVGPLSLRMVAAAASDGQIARIVRAIESSDQVASRAMPEPASWHDVLERRDRSRLRWIFDAQLRAAVDTGNDPCRLDLPGQRVRLECDDEQASVERQGDSLVRILSSSDATRPRTASLGIRLRSVGLKRTA